MSDLFTLPLFADHPGQLALATAAVVAAYAVFALVGFGTALLAGAPLALVMPVARVVPTLALLDFTGSSLRGWQGRRAVARGEFARLAPGMLLGQLAGVALLSHLPPAAMAIGLGLFIVAQGARGLLEARHLPPRPAAPAFAYGIFGGLLGGLFGSGGFVYAAYLERRLASRDAFRATQALLIALSTGWRLLLCLWLGLLDLQVAASAVLLLPAMAAGIFLGRHIDLRLERKQLFRLLNGLLVASGLGLIARFAG